MILKFQSGSMIPWVLYTPLSINTASPRRSIEESSSRKSSSKGDSDSGKLTEKDLLGILKDMKILPSDSKLILPKLERFIRLQDMGDTIDPAAIAIQFIRSLQEIKNAEYRRERFEEAYKKVDKEGGLNEFAVNVSGELAVLNKENGEISFVTLDNLDTLNYRLLTNNDVLRLRAEEFGNADALTQLASNGVGMEKISQRINTLFHTLGEDGISNDGYTRNPEAHVMNLLRSKVLEIKSSTNNEQAAQELYDAAKLQIGEGISQKGLYKYTEGNTTSNRQLGEALQYIYNGLLPNERTILDLRSGGKKGDGIKAITHMLISTSSTDYKFNLDMLENENGVRPGTKESADSQNSGLYTNIVKGLGEAGIGNFLVLDSDGYSFVVKGKSYPYIQDLNGTNIETCNLAQAMQKGIPYKGGNYAITFGETPLNGNALLNVLFEADGSTMRVILPIKEEAGKIVPDLEVAKEHSELINLINLKGFNDPQVLTELQKSGLFKDNGQINPAKFLVYLIANGKTTSKVITPNDWAQKFEATQEDEDLMNKYLASEVDRLDWGELQIDTPWFNDTFYKGIIFIPITENELNAGTNLRQHFNSSKVKTMELNYLIGEGWRNLNSTNIDDD